jgi:hypothetical protein|tara:strand:+ start:469 stop:939 length:471 start_codon:yes stop_codon:yes gene_type:complete
MKWVVGVNMAAILLWSIGASALTAVADWAGWHFVWKHEFESGEAVERKRNATSIFISYFLPFMPVLIILLGPEKLNYYDEGFAIAGAKVMFALLGVMTGGVAMSAWSFKRKEDESKNARELIDKADTLPEEALTHLGWTTAMLGISSLVWFSLLAI